MGKFGLLAVAILVGGCRLLVDVDTVQCEEPGGDRVCLGLLGDGYVCGKHGVCVEDTRPECEQDQDCVTLRGERFVCSDAGACVEDPLPEQFACLAKAPSPPANIPDEITIGIQVADFITLNPLADVTVRACLRRDLECSAPVDEAVTLGTNGVARLDVKGGFDGFFELEGGDYLPAIFSFNRPVYTDVTVPGPSMLTPLLLQAIVDMSEAEFSPDSGIVVADLVDCNGDAAAGIRISNEGEPAYMAFYFKDSLPDYGLSETTASDKLGVDMLPRAVAGFNGVKPGFLSVEADLVEPAYPFESTSVIVRTATLTFTRMYAGEVK